MRKVAWIRSLGFFVGLGAASNWATAPASAAFAECKEDYKVVGLPERGDDPDGNQVQDRCFTGFALLHNNKTKIPDWVIERLTIRSIRGSADRNDNFHADKEIAPGSRSELTDYEARFRGHGFDRGHQAPAADDKFSQAAMDETFILSNMAPQVGIGFNRHKWRYLETAIRSWIACGDHKQLFVMTGPIYSDDENQVLGPHRVAIPDAFYKVIYDPDQGRAIGFVMENKKHTGTDLTPFVDSIDHIEELTGIDFLPALSLRTQRVLESQKPAMWAYNRSCPVDEK